MKPQLEDAIGELAAETMAMGVLPLTIDYLEGYVLIRWAGMEPQSGKVFVVGAGLQEILGSGTLVDKVWVEDIELIALHNLGWRIVKIVVCLIVLVPLKACVDTVEEAGLSGAVFVSPQVSLACQRHLHTELGLICPHPLLSTSEKYILSTFTGITYDGRKRVKMGRSEAFLP